MMEVLPGTIWMEQSSQHNQVQQKLMMDYMNWALTANTSMVQWDHLGFTVITSHQQK